MLKLINANIPGYQGLQQVVVEKERIAKIMPCSEAGNDSPNQDLAGDWLSLGGVDLQINGCLGLPFPDLDFQHLPTLTKISQYLWQQGVDAYLPTIVTTAVEKIHQSLAVLDKYIKNQPPQDAARVIGVHLEGPFLNFDKRGAHPAEFLLPLTLDEVRRVLSHYTSIVKIITLAPELDPSGEVVSYLHQQGIIVSLGHSLASATEAKRAFHRGASMVTHAFNAMPSLHHRQPGLLGEAIVNPRVYCGLIVDGQHVDPIMISILLKASQFEHGIFLVSDALAPIGLAEGVYPWDDRRIEIKNGTARLEDGTFAGTTLPLLQGAVNLVKWGLADVESAIATVTVSPRQAIGLSTDLVGQPINSLLRWQECDRQLSWQRIIV